MRTLASPTFAWSCACGEGGAGWSDTREDARHEGELHMCRAGKLRASAHAIVILERSASAAA